MSCSESCYYEPMDVDPPSHRDPPSLCFIIYVLCVLLVVIVHVLYKPISKRIYFARWLDQESIGGRTGYLTSCKTNGNKLFYWFFPSKNNARLVPLVLFLAGGPGLSFMNNMFSALGPFGFDNGLQPREYSWNHNHNLLLIDQPVGTGFSYSEKGKCPNSDSEAMGEAYNALVEFYQMFPEYKTNPFYIAGESYAGHYIPLLASIIHEKNASENLQINMVGMMIGNGLMDAKTQIRYSDILLKIGLIDVDQHNEIMNYEWCFRRNLELADWVGASGYLNTLLVLVKFYSGVNLYNIKQPVFDCTSKNSALQYPQTDLVELNIEFKDWIPKCLKTVLYKYSDLLDFMEWMRSRGRITNWKELVNTKYFKNAFNIGDRVFNEMSGDVYNRLKQDIVKSVKPRVEQLLEAGYKIMFYNGDQDLLCAYPMIEDFLNSLDYSGKQQYQEAEWRDWCEDNQLIGKAKEANNLSHVVVGGAGHAAATDQPIAVLQLLHMFTGVSV